MISAQTKIHSALETAAFSPTHLEIGYYFISHLLRPKDMLITVG
jgi:hypothetical protein